MTKIEQIKNHEVYKQVLKDSCGGVLYNVANRGKYDATEIMQLWEDATPGEQSAAGGIMQGVFNFLSGK